LTGGEKTVRQTEAAGDVLSPSPSSPAALFFPMQSSKFGTKNLFTCLRRFLNEEIRIEEPRAPILPQNFASSFRNALSRA
jgi:hypothetical protein